MKPLPWSHTALEDFNNCPYSFYRKRVVKGIKEEQGEAAAWGEFVHKKFELRQGEDKEPLPKELKDHEPFMEWLDEYAKALKGTILVENRMALTKELKPTNFFSKDVWHRGVIDWLCLSKNLATVFDYKTGKPHTKDRQLKIFAIDVFYSYPSINIVRTHYHWTQTLKSGDAVVYDRRQLPELWGSITPDLRQYVDAFKTETWQKRQSGLCNGWCPVTDCEFWRPKRKRYG